MDSYEEIAYEVRDRICTITLDRPDRLNAFTVRMTYELIDAFDKADQDDDVRVVVMTGRGRGFCAGADLGTGGGTFDHSDEGAERQVGGVHRDEGGMVSLRVFEMNKPVIAAINGPAVGVGVTMTLPMDMRLASTNAKFGLVFARRGIAPEAASSWFLPRLVGISQALEWVSTGRVFTAQEALAGGLVRSLHEPDELLPAAYELAKEIAENTSATSVAVARQLMWRMLGEDHPMAAHRLDSRAVQALGASRDAREGVMSFLEKRPAKFVDTVTANMPDFVPWWTDPEFS